MNRYIAFYDFIKKEFVTLPYHIKPNHNWYRKPLGISEHALNLLAVVVEASSAEAAGHKAQTLIWRFSSQLKLSAQKENN